MKAAMNGNGFLPPKVFFLVRVIIVAGLLLALLPATSHAYTPPPVGTNSGPTYTALDSWSFYDHTNWTSDYGCAPVSVTNLFYSYLGDGESLGVNTNLPAWLQYNVVENDNTTNLTVDQGTVVFWFAPNWTSTNLGGTGPGEYGRLLEAGSYTPDSSYGWWSVFVDPGGNNIFFAAQTNDLSSNVTTYLSAPISWTTNYFHNVILTYTATNTLLYLDGALATNGPGVTIYPGPNALTNGFYIGSDSNGVLQADGLFNDFFTFNVPLDAATILTYFDNAYLAYEMSPWNTAMFIASASSSQTIYTPLSDVITGAGYLQANGPVTSHIYGTNAYQVWMTNVTATLTGSNTTAISFTIEGGGDGYMYDVFATGSLESTLTNAVWAWLGQGGHFTNYTVSITSQNSFLILGTPLDSDHDGLTDAYELLVSHSNPTNYTTDGTGMADGWEVLYFGHTGINPNGDPDGDGLTTFQEWLMHSANYNPASWDSFTNGVGDGYQNYNGDGLANLMEASFGGNMMTNNLNWKVNTAGDGFPDEYKAMVGLNTNSAAPVPGLPAYSMNPIP